MKRLMLISSSMTSGGFLSHCEEDLRYILLGIKRVVFIPYALSDWDGYATLVAERFQELFGIALQPIHEDDNPEALLGRAEAVFVGGGNTFALLREMQRRNLLRPLREAVERGVRYIGSSAGANLAGKGIYTTNDMPIVEVTSLQALDLVPVSINPHYHELHQESPLGETREERINQFHEHSDIPVLAIFADSCVIVEGETGRVVGGRGARIFRKGRETVDVSTDGELDDLLRREE